MPFNVSTFSSQGLQYGGARASLFQVEVSLPSEVDGADAENQIRFLCKAASLPSSVIGQVEVPYFGRKIKMAGNRTFENWTITIMNDED